MSSLAWAPQAGSPGSESLQDVPGGSTRGGPRPIGDLSLRAFSISADLWETEARRRTGAREDLRALSSQRSAIRRSRLFHAVFTLAAASRPSSAMAASRILYFCTLPVTVMGKPSTNFQ